ncbi:MFS general substrate transporter [Gigaspora margarita]|uniref:MFS-type drug efflux transporter P55 n=1 Tax=Gigaspora margarita TaxID=4874 RepID=A0A8H3X3G6_GIGMA|nr:MFS general substrate transporter [Gigaspora margarita]
MIQDEPKKEITVDVKDKDAETHPVSTDNVQSHNKPKYEMKKAQLLLVFVGLSLAILSAALDQIIISTTLPAIALEFRSLDEIAWIGTAYLLAATAFQPTYGKLSDVFGRKPIFLMTICLLELGLLLCGLSINLTMLIISRVIVGLGGGGIIALAQIIITEIVSINERGKYQGTIGACWGIASIAGPLLGGALTDKFSWRWAFFVNLPIGAIAFISIFFLLHIPNPTGSIWAKFKLIDWWGTFTLVVSTILLLLSLNWGGSKYAWNNPIIIILLCFGGIGYIIFALVEWKVAKDPLAPGRLFKNPKTAAYFGLNFFNGMGLFSLMYFIPLYFQVVKSESATTSGLELIPYMLGVVSAYIFSGQLISRTTYFSYGLICAFGSILMAVGGGLIGTFSLNTSEGEIISYSLITGIGIGLIMQTTILAGQGVVEYKDMAIVTSLLQFYESMGTVFGVAIMGTVFNNVFNSNLPPQYQGKISLHDFDSSTLGQIPDVIVQTFVLAFDVAFKVVIGMGSFAFILSLFMIKVKPHRDDPKRSESPLALD